MNKATILMSALVLGIAATGARAADDTLKVEKPIRVLLGGFSPKESGGTGTWTSLGVGYDIQKTTATKPTVYGVYVDYATKKKSGVTNSLTGVGVSGRFYLDSANASGKPYAGIGLGSYTAKASGNGVSFNKSKFGAKAEIGYELNNGFLGSLSYNTVKIEGGEAGGTSFRVGYRF